MLEGKALFSWSPVCAAIATLLAPHAEVVLHDVGTDRILGVWNPSSGRKPGDPSLLGELDGMRQTTRDVFGPYEKLLPDGRRLTSVSAVIRNGAGQVELVLCINLDRGPFEQAAALLAAFAAPTDKRPEPLFAHDWRETINDVVGSYVRKTGLQVAQLNSTHRMNILDELDAAGIFGIRGAAPLVARALKISRSSLYAYLSETRSTQ
jgi:predicted transcriptional regulator YheO